MSERKHGARERRPTKLVTTSETSHNSSSVTRLNNGMDSLKLSSSSSGSSSRGSSKTSSKPVTYTAERVTGSGSFGVVYQAVVVETKETVAIKKVLQDNRFKNREVSIMKELDHPDVIRLKHCFYSRGKKPEEVYLNLVMQYVPETLHRSIRAHAKATKYIPMMYVKVYMYQMTRALAYIHSLGVCHRDIKPQNVLLDPKTHKVFLCDFGSAKILDPSQGNVAYICSRYYRAPELVFEATHYTTAIDVWSLGCVFGELMLGSPLFPGNSGVDQLIEIIKILGTPTREQILEMNPNAATFRFPQIKPHDWQSIFKSHVTPDAMELISIMLTYEPRQRGRAFECLAHSFYDDLRQENAMLPNGKPLPPLFNFSKAEIARMERKGLSDKLVPRHLRQELLGKE